jgi:hypothetical protein
MNISLGVFLIGLLLFLWGYIRVIRPIPLSGRRMTGDRYPTIRIGNPIKSQSKHEPLDWDAIHNTRARIKERNAELTRLEKEHLGDPDLKTGIYHPSTTAAGFNRAEDNLINAMLEPNERARTIRRCGKCNEPMVLCECDHIDYDFELREVKK